MHLLRLVLCINIFVSVDCTISRQTNVSLLVEESEDAFEFTCILEGNLAKSAVTWLTPLMDSNVIKPSYYLPESKTYENYEKDVDRNWKPDGWSLSSSFDFPFKPVTDYRWEEFPIYVSSDATATHLSSFPQKAFTVSLSLRGRHPAIIYLCNAENSGSNEGCFVIGINGTNIEVLFGTNESSRESMTSDEPKMNEWFHFTITYSTEYETNKTKLKLSTDNKMLTCATDGYYPQKKHLLVQSRGVCLWKMHKYKFLSTTSTHSSIQLGQTFFRNLSNINCISLHVALCHTCVLDVTTEYNDNLGNYKTETTVEVKIKKKQIARQYLWKEVRLIREITNATDFRIYILPYNTNNSKSGFWAIDDIRACYINEIRVANFNIQKKLVLDKSTTDVYANVMDKIKCHPLRDNPVSISNSKSATLNCEDQDKLGFHCNIACNSIFGEKKCEEKLICMGENAEGSSNCHCSVGYQGAFCAEKCQQGTWGFACKEKCGNCKNSACNTRNGTCQENCVEGFAGESCNNPATVKNLSSVSSMMHEIAISWNSSFSLSNIGPSYAVKYKHKKYISCKSDVQNASQFTEKTSSLYLRAKNLLPYSEYVFEVSATINGVQGESNKIIVTTSAIDILQSDELISNLAATQDNPDNFPLLTYEEPPCSTIKGKSELYVSMTCLDEWCTKNKSLVIPYANKIDEERRYAQAVPDLTPYTNYLVRMMPRRVNDSTQKTSFQTYLKTREQAPPKVTELTAYSRDESVISLRWKPPYPPHGKLVNYGFTCIGTTKCDSLLVSPSTCSLWKHLHCADIKNLEKDKEYTIKVEAININVEKRGEAEYTTKIYTQQSRSDPPTNIHVTWNNDIPILHWQHPDITNGPIVNFSIQINIKESEHLNVSLFNENVTVESPMSNYAYEMASLEYSTLYEITVYAINKFRGNPSDSRNITMPPRVPSLAILPKPDCTSDLKCKLQIQTPVNTNILSYLYVIIDSNPPTELQDDKINKTQLLFDSANNAISNKTGWLAVAMSLSNSSETFSVPLGDGTNTTSKYGTAINKVINNETHYIYVILENNYLYKKRFSQRYIIHSTANERLRNIFPKESTETTSAFYGLFSLLLIPIIIGGWIIFRKFNRSRNTSKTSLCKWCDRCEQGESQNDLVPLEVSKPTAIIKPKKSNFETATTPLLTSTDEDLQYTCKILLENFEEYVKDAIGTNDENGELVRQHSLFIRGQTKPWEYGMKKQNKFKNRYNNLIAYDHTRVILEKINNDAYSDYINANYIDGYHKPKAYIATQGPKPTTVCDFWRMIWQEHVTTIVMVANVKEDGKKKTEQYWPNLNAWQQFGSLNIYHNNSEVFSNYIFRTLTLTKGDEERTVTQLHFTSWPDHGVPQYPQSLVPFIKKLLTTPQQSAPIVVHCSAGVGRTGTIILCDYVLRMAANESAVDFLATLQQMRDQRANLVDNPNQYMLAHLVVLEALFGLDTTISCDQEIEQKVEQLIHSDGLCQQMDYLDKVSWQDQAMRSTFTSLLNPANNKKNRFSYIVPDGHGRVYLSRCPATDEHSDYINAVEVDGFQIPGQFIVTQQPLPNTIFDFWRMVHEKEVATIISLNDIIAQDESSSMFWPEEDDMFELEFIKVTCTEKEEYPTHNVIKIILTDGSGEEESRKYINIVHMKGWAPLKCVPDTVGSLIAVWEETAKLSRGDAPTVVTCYDGAKASGVYVALSFVIEKIKLEQICDVCLAVRTVRLNRKQFMTNVEQFELIYRAAVHYLKGFETYSNFPIINKEAA